MQNNVAARENADLRHGTYTFSEIMSAAKDEQSMSLLALSHTKAEHLLYELMLAETRREKTKIGAFTVRHLMIQTGFHNYSGVRRARAGLIEKMSIEPQTLVGDAPPARVIYVIYAPDEIFDRRQQAGLPLYPKEVFDSAERIPATGELMERLVKKQNLSRREAQVAIRCAEGLTNAQIGAKLFIQEDTVKFHLRNIFIKFKVRRRTELIARLFGQASQTSSVEKS